LIWARHIQPISLSYAPNAKPLNPLKAASKWVLNGFVRLVGIGALLAKICNKTANQEMRKQVKRKRYALIDPIQHGIIGAAITPRHILDKLRFTEYAALDAITKGMGTIHDWRTLVDVLNLAEMMGKNGVGPEVLPICHKAQESLHKAALRFQETKRMGLDGVGIQAIRDLLEYADLQQASVSRAEFERYVKKTKDYIKSNGNLVVEIE
jgi:hypothetical protein